MKLTKETIKQMIKEVLVENQQSSMLLTEKEKRSKYDRIIDALEGKTEDVDTIGLMSGQNPMAKASSTQQNARLKTSLEKRIGEMGLEMIRIGGVFAHNPEQSAMILNPTEDQMEVLCREFQQEAFVYGEKYPIDQERDFMIFKIYDIDYDNPMGYRMAPGSKDTATIRKQADFAGQDTDFSVDPTSGKKFGLELYEQLLQQQINEVRNKRANSMIGAMKRDHEIKQLEAILRRVRE
tara:strand:- start:1577 stop:2287 length:711 start_codon:yes stop_codon:yes gene_type:complete